MYEADVAIGAYVVPVESYLQPQSHFVQHPFQCYSPIYSCYKSAPFLILISILNFVRHLWCLNSLFSELYVKVYIFILVHFLVLSINLFNIFSPIPVLYVLPTE
jgi:hypothetical protein